MSSIQGFKEERLEKDVIHLEGTGQSKDGTQTRLPSESENVELGAGKGMAFKGNVIIRVQGAQEFEPNQPDFESWLSYFGATFP